jgi:flagellin
MSSILTNAAALSALQSLSQTQADLKTTEHQVSTGLAVSSAADNASYWSIATQLSSNSGVVTATNQALAQSQAVMSTASSAINSIITTINSIESALTQAATPGASISNINTTLGQLGKQLTDAVNGASFNGLNLLDGSAGATLNFVAGFNATTSGGTFNTIQFSTSAMTSASAGTTTSTVAPNVTDAKTINQIINLVDNSATATLAYGSDVITVAAGTAPVYATTQDGTGTSTANATGGTGAVTTPGTAGTVSIQSMALDGSVTTTIYTAVDANGNATDLTTAASLQETKSTLSGSGMLKQGSTDLTNITTSASTASGQLADVEKAMAAVTTYASTIGAAQNRMTAASTFNSALTTNYATGVSALVDADMNTASTRLQALQTQEQLGIQSLSIANQNAQLILKLFP